MARDSGDPFRDYHRGRFWMSLLKIAAGTAAAVALVAGVLQLAAGAPPYTAQPAAARGLPGPAVDSPAVGGATAIAPKPTPTPTTAPTAEAVAAALGVAAAPEPSAITGPGRWAILINTTGYQAELDKCLWVRMDLGATAPIVGAHNNCGGSIVLAMKVGDIVTLSGTALDGEYTVIDARNAHAGDSAAAATSGWSGAVILQTCYFNAGGEERLLELERA